MRWSNCGSDNPAGKKFCSECGAGLSRGCPQCGAENAPAAKFCVMEPDGRTWEILTVSYARPHPTAE